MREMDIPSPLMTSELGSFARSTIEKRKPQIIAQVIEDNDYSPEIVEQLSAFREEIAREVLRPLTEQAKDVPFWNSEAGKHQGRAWLELPWFFAETFFYRRLLEAVGYFQPGPWYLRDPFAVPKRVQERAAVEWLAEHGQDLQQIPANDEFEVLFHSCLWGNRADLSNLTVREQVRGGMAARQELHNLIIDDTAKVGGVLSGGVGRVDFVNDNAGRELLFDLMLADYLLSEGWAQTVIFHLKSQPYFVSDAMLADVKAMLVLLQDEQLGQRLQSHLDTGRWMLRDDPFWATCLMFRQMPLEVTIELSRSSLVVLKGDVNYRRLLDDAHWPHTARMDEIAAYFPAPFVTLRTLKGEIMVGLAPGQAKSLAAEDPDWLINGKRGLIHYIGS
jgi:uncharacterized protein with ATP-grasp and redox domains